MIALASTFAAVESAEAVAVSTARRQLHDEYTRRFEELAAWSTQRGLAEQARIARSWLPPQDPHAFHVALVEEALALEPPAAGESTDVAAWRTRFTELRRAHADQLYALAQAEAAAGRASMAFRLLHWTIRENPAHEAARRALGYERVDGAWRTPFEIKKLAAGEVRHAQFGWLPAEHAARYEQGERYYQGRWLSADDEQRVRGSMARAWRVETEHYIVRTNVGLEEGVKLARRLETLHAVWRQLFVGYYASAAQVAAAFDDRPLALESPRRLQVVYYRSREEYIQDLASEEPRIGITLGYYMGDRRTVYFFARPDEDLGTQFHEAAHQLFSETRPVARGVGQRANFWIIEGIACYMESLRSHGDHARVGGLDAERVRAARQRILVDRFYVPLQDFTRFGMLRFQHDERIRRLYSQASGLTHFLLHYDDSRHGDALMAYLTAVYTGRDGPATLAELTGADYATLDRQYLEFFQSSNEHLN